MVCDKAPLENIADVIDPHPSHRAPKAEPSGGIPFIGIGDIDEFGTIDRLKARQVNAAIYDEHKERYSLNDNLLALGRVASIGKVIKLPKNVDPFVISPTLAVIKPTNINIDYLKYALQSPDFIEQMLSVSTGSTRKSVGMKVLRKLLVPIFDSDEQKRIVAILDEAFAGIDQAIANTEKNLASARELFESTLNTIFTQKGEGWEEKTISELVSEGVLDKPLDGNHGETHPKKADFVDVGVPFIMASDLINGEVDQLNCNFISREQADGLRKGFSKDGDVLLSHKGTIGRVAILNTDLDYVMLTPQVTYYRTNNNILYNQYLYFFFQSPKFKNEMGSIAGIGTTRAYIGITRQMDLSIAYPDVEQQKEIAKKLFNLVKVTENFEATYKQKLASLNELKQSLLQKAFSGELTADMAHDAQAEAAA